MNSKILKTVRHLWLRLSGRIELFKNKGNFGFHSPYFWCQTTKNRSKKYRNKPTTLLLYKEPHENARFLFGFPSNSTLILNQGTMAKKNNWPWLRPKWHFMLLLLIHTVHFRHVGSLKTDPVSRLFVNFFFQCFNMQNVIWYSTPLFMHQ